MFIKKIYKKVSKKVQFFFRRVNWKRKNRHNHTRMKTNFPSDVVSVGKLSYGDLNVHYYKTQNEKLRIGNYCSIADEVHFFLGGEHDYHNFSTFPFKNYISNDKVHEAVSRGEIVVEDDCWIGYGATILSGVTIGKGSVIGAKSVVAKDVPPYSIFAGNSVIKKRFDDDIIKKISMIDFSKLELRDVEQNLDLFYTNLTEDNVDDILKHVCLVE